MAVCTFFFQSFSSFCFLSCSFVIVDFVPPTSHGGVIHEHATALAWHTPEPPPPPTHLLRSRTVQVPAADLVVASEHVHGHHANGEGDGADDHLPGVRRHQEAMGVEQGAEHGGRELQKHETKIIILSFLSRTQGLYGLMNKQTYSSETSKSFCLIKVLMTSISIF